MASDIKLYDVFGELLYVVAKADGIVQAEEVDKLKEMLAGHPWAAEIEWSFQYEADRDADPEDLYRKVILYCQDRGPDPEYQKMIEVMEAMSKASDGVDLDEGMVMEGFFHELTERFRKDIEALRERGV